MKGFTLIELLVVVVIIGILTAIALPQYELVVEKSRASEAMVNAKAIQDAVQRHLQEFPEDSVTNCTKIADVQLKGGKWNNGTEACKASTDTTFTTKNFEYVLGGTTFTVTRKDGDSSLYAITFYSAPEGENRVVTSSIEACADDYKQICKLYNM